GTGVSNGSINIGALDNLTGANSWAVPISLFGPSAINTDVGQLTLTGAITGAADLTKVGGGTLLINTATNPYFAQTNVNAGIVQVNGAGSLGSIAGGTVGASGAMLQLTGAVTFAGEKLTLNGTGLGLTLSGLLANTGALLVTAGATW